MRVAELMVLPVGLKDFLSSAVSGRFSKSTSPSTCIFGLFLLKNYF